jgi:pentatricopeptide repeat protein
MQSAGFEPTVRTFNSLLEACKRCAHPELAHSYLHEVMPAVGVQPDSISWNSLLGAYGRAGHIDGAYATWQVRLRSRLNSSCLFPLGLIPCVLGLQCWVSQVRGALLGPKASTIRIFRIHS